MTGYRLKLIGNGGVRDKWLGLGGEVSLEGDAMITEHQDLAEWSQGVLNATREANRLLGTWVVEEVTA